MARKTPLNATHRASGARMVDFGGWEMPLHYGSQVEEHHAVRRDAGLFDVSHMRVVDVDGPGARALLRRALANDVAKLATPGRALYSCLLADDGGVVDDLIAYFLGGERFRCVVNAGTADKDIAWLEALRARFGAGARITPRPELALVAIQGPRARERFWAAHPELQAATESLEPFHAALAGDAMVARTGYTGEDGFEIILPAERAVAMWESLVAAGAHPCGLGARDTLRLEAGMNLYGQDMDERVSPLEAGLAWTVDLSGERDFVGKSALLAHAPRHEFLGLVLTEPGGVLRAHQKVHAGAGEGEITSGTFSPTLGKSIALARLPRGTRPGDAVQVLVRDKRLAARVVKPVFARRGKSVVDSSLPSKDSP
ncbi:MAG TPA: glycine cleavage system aminomethyltransferase GcvT [Usitatibacter sp.]|jgi:aminomethyltransferase|nr:glycine cleavage system aminomethyltransferase GcvT [Usitatibacter sp.]